MDIKSLVVRSTIGLVGLGGLGAGGYYGYQALNNKTEIQKEEPESKTPSIEEALKNEGYTLLSEDAQNDGSWNAILSSYKTVIKQHTDLKFEGFEPSDDDSTAVNTLKQKCQGATTKTSDNEEILKKAKKWCVVPIKVSKKLGDKGFVPLKTNTSKADEEESEWKSKIKSYIETKKSNPSLTQFIDAQDSSNITPDNIVAAKTKCQQLGEILNHAESFETSLSSYEAWCGNEKE